VKRGALLLGLAACAAPDLATGGRDNPLTSPRTAWWRDAKYGMFIHWGVYSVPAGEYRGRLHGGASEWLMNTARIPIAEYETFAPRFNPVKFDARAWARLAKDAGMKYVVITSKHHDGFAMWPTKVNDWSIAGRTPFRRDPLRELADACRAEGLRFGLYYSILDWHKPAQKGAGKAAYVTSMKAQLRELATAYDPDVLWFDGEWEPWWTAEDGRDLAAFVRSIAPRAVVNNRVGKRGGADGDYETPENEIPRDGWKDRLWEACWTTNNSWGFHKGDSAWKSPGRILRMLADIAGKGGNLLLNVGPTSDGEIPDECAGRLREVGAWLSSNGDALYGTTGFAATSWGGITKRGRRLYAIVCAPGTHDLPVVGAKPITLADAPAVVVIDCDGEPRRTKSRAELTAEGLPLPPGPDGIFRLLAVDAALRGRTIRLEQQEPAGNAGFWTDPADFVEWFVEARGDFDVVLRFAVNPGAGGDFRIVVGSVELTGSVASTGGWNRFREIAVGRVRIDGRVSIAVKPVRFNHAMMNLAGLRLTPVK
jgi:alpha-L-fucosidase